MFQAGHFKGKRFLVTGGGTGLGKVMTEGFLALGAEVAICGRRKGVLDEAAAEMMKKSGGKVTTHACDIRVAEAVEDMVAAVWQDGPLDGLVNNAAGNFISRTEDLSARGFDAIAGIVFHGSFYCTSAVGKRWIKEKRGGSVLSILTTWVRTGSPYVVPSAMSKAGVAAMTRSLAVEWGPKGIRLNAIAPGPFPTEGAWARLSPTPELSNNAERLASNPMRRNGRMPELANLAAFLMSDECAYLNGEIIAIDGGQWMNSAGGYGRLAKLGDDDWKRIRESIRNANEKDKAKRSA